MPCLCIVAPPPENRRRVSSLEAQLRAAFDNKKLKMTSLADNSTVSASDLFAYELWLLPVALSRFRR
jgi:hypothetical protein